MELGLHSGDDYLITKTINLYPWIRWNPHLSDQVIKLQPNTELYQCGTIDSLSRDISCLTVSDIGIMSNIPAVSKHLADISLEQNITSANDGILYRHATASHLEAADELLSVLGDAVCVRVKFQDARCNVCLLQQHSAESRSQDSAVSCSGTVSDNIAVELVDTVRECPNDFSTRQTISTSFCDASIQCSSHIPDGASSSSNHFLYQTQRQQFVSSSNASIEQVFNSHLHHSLALSTCWSSMKQSRCMWFSLTADRTTCVSSQTSN